MGRHDLAPFGDVFNIFDSLFRDFSKDLRDFPWKQWKFGFADDTFPPSDFRISQDRSITAEFIVAGYPEDKITLDFEGDYMVLDLASATDDEKCHDKYICRCIKRSASKSRYYIPSDKYDRKNVKAELKDGILTVTIPSKEKEKSEPVEININKS
tara:strand:+ start:301 stop:765 length:465 start_codon:yes stop_codon:yes gene_type:complete